MSGVNCGLLSDGGKHCNGIVYYAIAYIASWACSTGYCSLLPGTSCSKAEKPLHTLDHPSRGRVCVAESLVSLVKVMRLHGPWASESITCLTFLERAITLLSHTEWWPLPPAFIIEKGNVSMFLTAGVERWQGSKGLKVRRKDQQFRGGY